MRFSRIKGVLFAATLLGTWAAPGFAYAEGAPAQHRAWLHLKAVLLSAEYGGRVGIVERWARPPAVTIVGGSAEDRALIRDTIIEWNAVLDGTGFGIREADHLSADIGVIFTPRENFREIAAMYGFRYVAGGVGFAGIAVDARHRAQMAIVMVAEDLAAEERRATLVQELYHTLGPINDSPYFPSSVLFEDGLEGSTATTLAMVDRKLLRFLYQHLKPGDREAEMRRAFERHWHLLD